MNDLQEGAEAGPPAQPATEGDKVLSATDSSTSSQSYPVSELDVEARGQHPYQGGVRALVDRSWSQSKFRFVKSVVCVAESRRRILFAESLSLITGERMLCSMVSLMLVLPNPLRSLSKLEWAIR